MKDGFDSFLFVFCLRVFGMSCVRAYKIEALFIPEGWWHQVTSSRGTVAVNVWFKVRVVYVIYMIRLMCSTPSTIRFAVVDTNWRGCRLVVVTPGGWGEANHCRQTTVARASSCTCR